MTRRLPRLVPAALQSALLPTLAVALVPALLVGPAALASSAAPARPRVPVLGVGRALASLLPGPGGSAPGAVRLTASPVTGRVCVSATGVRTPDGTTAVDLELALPDGTRTMLTDGLLAGCADLTPGVATDLLARPGAYQLVLAASDGTSVLGTLAAAAPASRPYAVGTRRETLLDRTRGTARRGSVPATPGRRLALSYWYPASGPAGPADVAGAEPSLEGPFPVVLFAHGYATTPQAYARTLHALAAAGYLVVAPLFPGSGVGPPGSPTEGDLGQQPRDLRVALDAVAAHATDPGSWLGGLADAQRVAVAGHSDGGSTAAAAGLLAGYTDPRYDAVIVLAGARFRGALAASRLPLLLVSGDRDEYNAPRVFADVLAAGRGPRVWVQALRGRHEAPFTASGRQPDTLRRLEIAFLDRFVLGGDTRSAEQAAAAVPGVTRVRAGRV